MTLKQSFFERRLGKNKPMDLSMDDVVCSKYLKASTRNGFSSPKNIVTTHGTSFFSKLPIVKENI